MTNRPAKIVILTGAGISAESGIATFRDANGLWAKHDISEVATPEAFARDPGKVYAFYNRRRQDVMTAEPNAAHRALAELEAEWPRRVRDGAVLVVTQNVDPLHERAGTKNLIHMHGALQSAWCLACDGRHEWTADLSANARCPVCAATGRMRPDIVWFGEIPYRMDDIWEALTDADLFVSIGTSGNVYPAAGFVRTAREMNAQTVEINLEPSDGANLFHERRHGRASVEVPRFVEQLLADT